MCKLVRRAVGAAAFGLILATSIAFAQQAQTVRVRGTVEAADGPVITVKARDGKAYKIKLTDNAAVRGIIKAALSDIKENSFIGVTGMPQADGSQKALEIHILPRPHARHRRRTPALGSHAQQHHDQCNRRADGEGRAGRRDHAQIQGRGEENPRCA